MRLDGATGSGADAAGLRLSLLGEFRLQPAYVSDHERAPDLPVSPPGQRVLAMLAFRQRPVRRAWVADVLWPDSDSRHASWNLRSTLHRLPQPDGRSPVVGARDTITLADHVAVDVVELVRAAAQVSGASVPASVGAEPPDDAVLDRIGSLEHDVLPDWSEDWVVVERERHRQLRLHALESLARRLIETGRLGLAVHAGLAAVQAEPLRESAHRVVIEAYLAEGNLAEAVRQYRVLADQLVEELGITPSPDLRDLVFLGREHATETRRPLPRGTRLRPSRARP